MANSAARPNLLLIMADQLRSDWLAGAGPHPVRTPHLAELQRAGVTFTRTICPSPLCAPSRACLASGLAFERCGVPDNKVDYPLDQPTFYQALRDAGYHVMGCGKFDLHKSTRDWGLDGQRLLTEWGFSAGIDNEGKFDGYQSGRERPKGPYLQFLESRGLRRAHLDDIAKRREDPHRTEPTALPDDAYCDNWITHNGLDLLQQAPTGRPWFLQINFAGPHNPWDVTAEMARWYADAEFDQPWAATDGTPARHRAVRRNYAAMIENIDRRVGDVLAAVAARGELERTVVVFASDHGEMLGDHDLWGKRVPYQGSVGVPLIVAAPGARRGARHEGPATILDLGATCLDYAGLPVPERLDSRSLKPLLEGRESRPRTVVTAALDGWRLAYDGRYKLITGYGESPLLFDLAADPGETENLAAAQTGLVDRLAAHLERTS